MLKRYNRRNEDYLFSTSTIPFLTYSVFSKCLNSLVGLVGDFSSHSLRKGGATFMSMLNCSVMEIKSRGLWKSDCVYKYILPTLSAKKATDMKVANNF